MFNKCLQLLDNLVIGGKVGDLGRMLMLVVEVFELLCDIYFDPTVNALQSLHMRP